MVFQKAREKKTALKVVGGVWDGPIVNYQKNKTYWNILISLQVQMVEHR